MNVHVYPRVNYMCMIVAITLYSKLNIETMLKFKKEIRTYVPGTLQLNKPICNITFHYAAAYTQSCLVINVEIL